MKHFPNICTLANLFFGCIAITYILHAPVFFQQVAEDIYPVLGVEQMVMGSLFISLAALMDVFDGLAARTLNVTSALGRDLDSLADLVSFGVAPSMIMFKLLWAAYMSEPGAMHTPMMVMAPAFLLACFGALRLARFNQTSAGQQDYFTGMPIPAAGMLIASLPLIQWFGAPYGIPELLLHRWLMYGLIGIVCFLMVSKVRFLKWKAPGKGLAAWWPQLLIVLIIAAGAPVFKFAVVPLAFLVYILCSLVYRYPPAAISSAQHNTAG